MEPFKRQKFKLRLPTAQAGAGVIGGNKDVFAAMATKVKPPKKTPPTKIMIDELKKIRMALSQERKRRGKKPATTTAIREIQRIRAEIAATRGATAKHRLEQAKRREAEALRSAARRKARAEERSKRKALRAERRRQRFAPGTVPAHPNQAAAVKADLGEDLGMGSFDHPMTMLMGVKRA